MLQPADPAPEPVKPRRIPLAALLAATFGGLVAASVGLVLYLSVSANFSNTFSLLNRRTIELVAALELAIREDVAEVERGLAGAATLVGGPGQAPHLEQTLAAVLAATPAVDGLLVADLQGRILSGRMRAPGGGAAAIGEADADAVRAIVAQAGTKLAGAAAPGAPFWGNPARIGGLTAVPVTVAAANGYAIALASAQSLDRLVAANAEIPGMTVFVLDSAGERVIAHSRIAKEFEGVEAPLLAQYPDPALRMLGQAEASARFADASSQGIAVRISKGRDGFVFVTKPLADVANLPIQIGAYFAKTQLGEEILRATRSLIAGLLALLAAVLLAIVLGRRIARPLGAISAAAAAFSDFRIEDIPQLPASRIREIDDQSTAFNMLRQAMVEFSRYVPRRFVARLVRAGAEAKRPVTRKLTIMFSDIVSFTKMSEALGAVETARMLNEHFAMVAAIVEDTGGTVDKYIGDGMMAFWGAPDADDDHAAHALDAARRIAAALKASNRERAKAGLAPIRLRIGIHTGRVVVGNIGSPERFNYTIVGDAVNVAQRLEQQGRQFMEQGEETAILLSVATAERCPADGGLVPVGAKALPGRDKAIAVYRAVSPEAVTAKPARRGAA